MKTIIARASAAVFAAGLAGTIACGSAGGCGGTNINSPTAGSTPISMQCGAGTHLVGSQCVVGSGTTTCGAGTHLVGSQCMPGN